MSERFSDKGACELCGREIKLSDGWTSAHKRRGSRGFFCSSACAEEADELALTLGNVLWVDSPSRFERLPKPIEDLLVRVVLKEEGWRDDRAVLADWLEENGAIRLARCLCAPETSSLHRGALSVLGSRRSIVPPWLHNEPLRFVLGLHAICMINLEADDVRTRVWCIQHPTVEPMLRRMLEDFVGEAVTARSITMLAGTISRELKRAFPEHDFVVREVASSSRA